MRNAFTFEIRDMRAGDKSAVMPMVRNFYRSPAVDHPVSDEVLERSFAAAADPGSALRGLLLLVDRMPAGYCYLTSFYSAEMGGPCLMIEELYFEQQHRGKGLGSRVCRWLLDQYPDYPRFRLEVTRANQGAVRLYERFGFQFIQYGQMVLDRK